MSFKIVKANIIKIKSECMVNQANDVNLMFCWFTSLSLEVFNLAGDKLKKEVCDKDISNNNFYISKAYNLKNYQKIMHVYIDTYDPKAKKECVNKLNDVYKDIFEKAKQEGIKEIVIPLIGNGNSHFPLDISLKCAIETLYKIASKDNTINVVLSIYKGTQDITLIDNLTEIKYNGENFDKWIDQFPIPTFMNDEKNNNYNITLEEIFELPIKKYKKKNKNKDPIDRRELHSLFRCKLKETGSKRKIEDLCKELNVPLTVKEKILKIAKCQ